MIRWLKRLGDTSVSCAVFRMHRTCPVFLSHWRSGDFDKVTVCPCRCHPERRSA